MNINTIFASRTTTSQSLSATQFQSANTGQSFSSVMASMSHNKTSLAFKSSNAKTDKATAPYIAQAFIRENAVITGPIEPFNIFDYYPELSQDELNYKLELAKIMFGPNGDFAGKTNVEIYNTIEEWFINEFGENFKMAYYLGTEAQHKYCMVGENPVRFKELNDIGDTFLRLVSVALGGREIARETNRIRLFGDMSIEDIKDEIRAKYPMNLTNRDFILMFSEMEEIGAFDREVKTGTTISDVLSGYLHFSVAVSEANGEWRGKLLNWNSVLNKPVDRSLLFGVYNDALYVNRRLPSKEASDFLVKFFNGEKDDRGWFKHAYNIREHLNYFNYYEWLYSKGAIEIPDLLDEFLNDMEEHEEKLEENRSKYNSETHHESSEKGHKINKDVTNGALQNDSQQ